MKGRDQTVMKLSSSKDRTGYIFPSAPALFRRRLLSHLREQTAIIRTAADWTVLLYIIIPGGLLGGRYYYGFWQEELPAWSSYLPFAAIPLLLALLLASGGMMLFQQEGDSLFLLQRSGWNRKIMFKGVVYSLIVTALKISAAYVILLPFMIRSFGLSTAAAGALLALTVACGCCVKLFGHLVKVQHMGFRRWLWLLPAVTLPCGIYVWAAVSWSSRPVLMLTAAVLFAAAAAGAARHRLQLRGSFADGVREDLRQRMKIAGLLLSRVLDKPRPTRYKPRILRKSQPLLSSRAPESRFAAAGIKALMRNPAHLKLYLQFTGVSLAVILILPPVLKWLLFLVLTCMMAYWLSSFWSGFAGDDYIGILPFTKQQKAIAGSQALQILLLPYALVCAAVLCIPVYGWWGVLLFIPAGAAAGVLIARMFSEIRFAK
ncbi:hypothetical protein C2I18_14990 [Paenibacillus sp. PK3_47]|nr:hypothetical protein C2I18_14990 [Paenibacillus sp. PK3_47]